MFNMSGKLYYLFQKKLVLCRGFLVSYFVYGDIGLGHFVSYHILGSGSSMMMIKGAKKLLILCCNLSVERLFFQSS